MQICQPHWDRLRTAIKERGLNHLGAQTGRDAVRNAVTELEGRGDENEFDPLMACNNMIMANGLRILGLGVMAVKEDGTHFCPICEATKVYEEQWITGPSDSALQLAKEKGLV